MNRMWLLAAVATGCFSVETVVAENYVPGSGWQPFSWSTLSPGVVFVNREPFTFVVPSGCAAFFHITDSECPGEAFEIWNFGSWSGFSTPLPGCSCCGSCPYTEDFDHAFSNGPWSSGTLALGAGSYSLDFRFVQSCNTIPGGTAAFRIVFGDDCNCNGVDDTQDLADGTSPDCNQNGLPDECDVAFLTSDDTNGNGTPDECEPCFDADVDNDGDVGIGDFLLVLAQWGPCPPECLGDVDGDDSVGILDFLLVLASWGACTP